MADGVIVTLEMSLLGVKEYPIPGNAPVTRACRWALKQMAVGVQESGKDSWTAGQTVGRKGESGGEEVSASEVGGAAQVW